jgi:MFS family permease
MTATQIAMLGASYLWIYSLMQIFAGILDDIYSGVRVAFFGGVVFAVGALGFPLCTRPWMLYCCRMMQGLGASTFYLSMLKESERLFGRENYAVLLGIIYFIGYGGGMMGTLPLSWASTHWPWQRILLVAGVLSVLVFSCYTLGMRTMTLPPISQRKISWRPLWLLLKNRLTWTTTFSYTVVFTCYFVMQTLLGKKFLTDFAHLSPNQASSVIFFMTLISVVGILSISVICRVTGNYRVPFIKISTATCLLNSIVFCLAIVCHWPSWVMAMNIMLYAFSASFPGMFSMTVQEVNRKEDMALAAGLVNMVNYLGVVVTSLAVGWYLDWRGGVQTADGVVVYSGGTYLGIVACATVFAAIAFVLGWFAIPETKGKYQLPDDGVK